MLVLFVTRRTTVYSFQRKAAYIVRYTWITFSWNHNKSFRLNLPMSIIRNGYEWAKIKRKNRYFRYIFRQKPNRTGWAMPVLAMSLVNSYFKASTIKKEAKRVESSKKHAVKIPNTTSSDSEVAKTEEFNMVVTVNAFKCIIWIENWLIWSSTAYP